MYNFNDIDALIRNGEDPEAIAKAFTSRLNEAINANSRDKMREEAGHEFANAWNDLMDLWLENNDVPLDIARGAVEIVSRKPEFVGFLFCDREESCEVCHDWLLPFSSLSIPCGRL